jgi:integrase
VGDYLRSWLDSAHEQSPKTLERYRELAERQIIPHLGATKLQKLRPEAMRQWHSALLNPGLSARTVGHAHRLLRLVVGYAVKNGTLTRNAAAVHAPPRVVAREIEILKAEQITDVLAKLDGHTLFPIASLALATGLTPRRAARTAMGRYRLGWRHASRRAERRGDAVGLKSEATKDGEG